MVAGIRSEWVAGIVGIRSKPYRTLKRHLGVHGMTPEEYRIRYRLPSDYPMTAPAYSEARRIRAKQRNLGRKRRGASCSVAPQTEDRWP